MMRNVPKSAMERMKVPDEKEILRRERRALIKCEEAMGRIDWGMMYRHLHSPEAHQAYEQIRNQLRDNFYKVPPLVRDKRIDPYLQLYYEQFQPKSSFKESMLLKWTRGKLLAKERMPFFMCIGVLTLVSFAAGRFGTPKVIRENKTGCGCAS